MTDDAANPGFVITLNKDQAARFKAALDAASPSPVVHDRLEIIAWLEALDLAAWNYGRHIARPLRKGETEDQREALETKHMTDALAAKARIREAFSKLESQLAVARQDSERLDWLEKRMRDPRVVSITMLHPPKGLPDTFDCAVHLMGIGYMPRAESLRQAIDAAREASGDPSVPPPGT